MSDCNAIGALARMAIQGGSTPRTFSNTSERVPFITEDIGELHMWGGRRHGVGDLDVTAAAKRRTRTTAFGVLKVPATPEELHRWLPRTMWGTVVGETYSLGYAAAATEFDILVDRENETHRYTNCVVGKLTLSSSASNGTNRPELCMLEIHIYGTQELDTTSWPSPEPTFSDALNHVPYIHYETLFELNSVNIPIEKFTLTIDNKLSPAGYNQLQVGKFRSKGRQITFSASGAFVADTLAEAVAAVTTPSDGVLTLTHFAAMDCEITLSNLQNTGWQSPSASSPGHIPLVFSMTPGKSSGAEMLVVNDHTP
jgi:hypothetical protein